MTERRVEPALDLDLDLDSDPATGLGPAAGAAQRPAAADAAVGPAPAPDSDSDAGFEPGPGGETGTGSVAGRPSWWRRAVARLRRGALARRTAVSRCVVIGPSAAGKTLFLMSLDRCADARGHSYAGRYNATIADRNPDFIQLNRWLDRYLPRGLSLDASDLGTCLRPGFRLYLRRQQGARVLSLTSVSAFDGVGGLLVEDLAPTDPGFQRCRALLSEALANCDTLLICLPLSRWIRPDQEQALKEYIHGFIHQPALRRLLICFTMYEKQGVAAGRHAYRELARRERARAEMAHALTDHLAAVNNALGQFHDPRHGRTVWCVPVSTFGFVPANGGANLAPTAAGGERADTLLTRPQPNPDAPGHYDPDQVRQRWWQPFLTLDPFIFIATGCRDRRGTLIHRYDELWP
ncbi:MAG: hypothetical protein EA400_15785 [Chromatiaceae bacterium]|nr:MAG: hypothetical protein EA400_15785 [Chromatiaceae bacterium]